MATWHWMIKMSSNHAVCHTKGQIKLKADWHAIDSPKKWTKKFVFLLPWQSGNNWNLKFWFQVSSISGLWSKKTKSVHSVFGRIYGAPICLWFYMTFNNRLSPERFLLKRTCVQNHVKCHILVFNIIIIRWQSQKVHALLEHPPCLHLHNKTQHSGINLLILIIDFWMDFLKVAFFQ